MVFTGRTRLAYVPNLNADVVETLSRRANDADLHVRLSDLALEKCRARIRTMRSRLVWRHRLFSIGPQRTSDALRV